MLDSFIYSYLLSFVYNIASFELKFNINDKKIVYFEFIVDIQFLISYDVSGSKLTTKGGDKQWHMIIRS